MAKNNKLMTNLMTIVASLMLNSVFATPLLLLRMAALIAETAAIATIIIVIATILCMILIVYIYRGMEILRI